MTNIVSRASRRSAHYSWLAAGLVIAAVIAVVVATSGTAGAQTSVGLGNATPFGVLAGSTVTSTGATIVNGDLGLSPGTSVTGFPPGTVNGTTYVADGVAAGAQADLTTAYNNAAGQASTGQVGPFLGAGTTLLSGVYTASSSLDVGGRLTLNAQGNPGAVWIFQIGSTLVTDSATSIRLINGAQACNVFWQVGSSATLGTGTSFQGTIMALDSISMTSHDTVQGRALARNDAVTLIDDTITVPTVCTSPSPTPTPTTTTPTPTPTTTTPTPTPTPTTTTPTPSPSPTHTTTTPTPSPSPTRTTTTPTPSPSPTRTTRPPSPSPSPTRRHRRHHHRCQAPRPTPVPTTFPVTG
jgi:type VI secretion system secreted protein VgrG